jgi:hypothetical protein
MRDLELGLASPEEAGEQLAAATAAEKLSAAEARGLQYQYGTLFEEAPYPAGYFDELTSSGLAMEVEGLADDLPRMHRLLRSGGKLDYEVFIPPNIPAQSVARTFREYGFDVILKQAEYPRNLYRAIGTKIPSGPALFRPVRTAEAATMSPPARTAAQEIATTVTRPAPSVWSNQALVRELARRPVDELNALFLRLPPSARAELQASLRMARRGAGPSVLPPVTSPSPIIPPEVPGLSREMRTFIQNLPSEE